MRSSKATIRTLQRVERKRANNVRAVGQDFRLQHAQQSHRQHGLRAVDQRDGFLSFQRQRLDARMLQAFGPRDRLALMHNLAFRNQGQRQVSQRSQIATCPHAALRRNHGMDAAIHHLAQGVDHGRPNSRAAFGQRIRAQQHHRAHHVLAQRLAHSGCVRAHQIDLQLANVVLRNMKIGEMADAGIDRIGDAIAGHQVIDDGARAVHCHARFRLQQNRLALINPLAHVFESQIVAVNVERLHIVSVQFDTELLSAGSSRWPPPGSPGVSPPASTRTKTHQPLALSSPPPARKAPDIYPAIGSA